MVELTSRLCDNVNFSLRGESPPRFPIIHDCSTITMQIDGEATIQSIMEKARYVGATEDEVCAVSCCISTVTASFFEKASKST